MIKLYNTLTRKLEEFKPITEKKIGIYSCGPTVYWNQHIGNMYAYVQWDVLVRFLRNSGYEVKWIMNVTDVGHMTSDEDAGEDKMEKGAQREGLSVWDIAKKYLGQFLDSADQLNIQRPDVLCRATEHINEQIELIKKIEANGFTYKTKTGLVFDTAKFPDYAKFANLKLDKMEAGTRLEVDLEKKNPWDFLLWVTNKPEHVMLWDSPWGKGFPGWHIECTAMSIKYLGEQFDIHTGGIDHIPVHHTNEIAQAYGSFGHQTANYWLHNAWVLIKAEKISKSLGNIILVQDLAQKGFEPRHLRYLFLNSHYRTGMDFSWEALAASKQAYSKLKSQISKLKTENQISKLKTETAKKYQQKFSDALSEDLNAPQGLAVLWEMVKSNLEDSEKIALITEFDKVLGLKLLEKPIEKKQEIGEEAKQLLAQREEARQKKDYATADKIREQLESMGIKTEDKPTIS